MRVGLHFHGTDFDLGPALDLGLKSYTLLDLDRALVPHIVARHPDARIHIRQWAMVTDDPWRRAREAAVYIGELLTAFPNVEFWFSSANEPDIESFGGSMTEDKFVRWADYAVSWATYLRDRRDLPQDRLRLLYCAPSPGHQEDGPEPPIGYQVMGDAVRLYDGLAVHLYLDPEAQDEELQQWLRYRVFRPAGHKHAQDPGGLYHMPEFATMPLWITETNVTDARKSGVPQRALEFLETVARLDDGQRILGVDWFVWDSPDPSFETMRMCTAPALQQVWKDVKQEVAPMDPEFKYGFADLATRMRAKDYEVVAMAEETYNGSVAVQPVAVHYGTAWEDGYFFYTPGGQPIYIGPDPKG